MNRSLSNRDQPAAAGPRWRKVMASGAGIIVKPITSLGALPVNGRTCVTSKLASSVAIATLISISAS